MLSVHCRHHWTAEEGRSQDSALGFSARGTTSRRSTTWQWVWGAARASIKTTPWRMFQREVFFDPREHRYSSLAPPRVTEILYLF
jgi:hypothetical protein